MKVKLPDLGPAYANDMVEWAKTHCPGYITNSAVAEDLGTQPTTPPWEYFRVFYFSDDKDATLFLLRWS